MSHVKKASGSFLAWYQGGDQTEYDLREAEKLKLSDMLDILKYEITVAEGGVNSLDDQLILEKLIAELEEREALRRKVCVPTFSYEMLGGRLKLNREFIVEEYKQEEFVVRRASQCTSRAIELFEDFFKKHVTDHEPSDIRSEKRNAVFRLMYLFLFGNQRGLRAHDLGFWLFLLGATEKEQTNGRRVNIKYFAWPGPKVEVITCMRARKLALEAEEKAGRARERLKEISNHVSFLRERGKHPRYSKNANLLGALKRHIEYFSRRITSARKEAKIYEREARRERDTIKKFERAQKDSPPCTKQTTKRYTEQRKAPPYPANKCDLHTVATGNDGKTYRIVVNSKGVHRWILEKRRDDNQHRAAVLKSKKTEKKRRASAG